LPFAVPPVISVDHFARFGLPRRYALDLKALDQAYERLSFEHHPDFLAAAAADEKQRAEQAAAELNEAYRSLRSEPERAAYLLGLLARDAQREGKVPAVWQPNREALPPGFLQEMFRLQEEVDEAKGEAAQLLRSQINAHRLALVGARLSLFERAQSELDADTLQTLQSVLNQEQYLLRLLERLDGRNA